MVAVRQMLVASKNYKLKCPNTLVPEGWCVHNTYNDSSANNEVQYMINNTSSTSYHYAVDDKEVVQGLPTDRNGWHAGDGNNGPGNRKHLGLEICYSKSGGERYTKAEENAVQFLAQDLKDRGWGIDKIKKHQDFSGKYCPHRILDEGRWTSFLGRIQSELERLNKPMRLFDFYTGGYSGEALVEIHDYVKKTGWDFSAEINAARDVAFTIGVFGEGTEPAANFEKWLTDRRFAFQKRYKE